MTVPAWNVMNLLTLKDLLAIDEILEQLVEGVSNVQITVSIRWAVVQDKSISPVLFRSLG